MVEVTHEGFFFYVLNKRNTSRISFVGGGGMTTLPFEYVSFSSSNQPLIRLNGPLINGSRVPFLQDGMEAPGLSLRCQRHGEKTLNPSIRQWHA